MKLNSMRARMTLAFVFVLAPFLLISSHLILTQFRKHHLAPGSDPGWPPFAIFTAVSVFLFGGIAWLMIGRTLSPIGDLARQAEEASVDHPGVRLAAPSGDAEMRELVDTLNDFLGRMEEAAEEKAHFYGAASHELRTPLQALSGHLEVALSQARSAEDYAIALREAQEQTQRLTGLVQSILLLHQLQGKGALPKETIQFGEVLVAALESMRPLADARGLKVAARGDSLDAEAVPGHAEILIRNLLENALKYAPEGSEILIQFEGRSLTMANPIDSPLDVAELTRPFYRREASRTSSSGGNGLGLAICRAICAANDWIMTLKLSGSNLVIRVQFR